MSEEVCVVNDDGWFLWDTQRNNNVDLDFLRGRCIEYATIDEDRDLVLILEEIKGGGDP